MTNLVVFAGSPLARGAETHAQLVAWREPLHTAGVTVVGDDDAEAWASVTDDLARGGDQKQLKRLLNKAARRESQTVLLSSPNAGRALHDPENVRALRKLCGRNDLTCTVVMTVREQLDLLNAWYIHRILHMEMFKDFPSAVTTAIGSGRYDLTRELGPLLDTKKLAHVVVPYSAAGGGGAARATLAAAGLSGVSLDAFSRTGDVTSDTTAGEIGPVVIAATRLLHKRLSRLGVVELRDRAVLVAAAAQLQDRSRVEHWDDTGYWGWTPALTATVTSLFAASNAALADRVWGTAWPDPTPERTQTRFDFAGADPRLVADVMTTIQHIVDELSPRPGAVDNEGSDAFADVDNP